jgi:hypothetical protein
MEEEKEIILGVYFHPNKGTGSYFFYKDLKDYEYIGEL